jgi:hypothetical protein
MQLACVRGGSQQHERDVCLAIERLELRYGTELVSARYEKTWLGYLQHVVGLPSSAPTFRGASQDRQHSQFGIRAPANHLRHLRFPYLRRSNFYHPHPHHPHRLRFRRGSVAAQTDARLHSNQRQSPHPMTIRASCLVAAYSRRAVVNGSSIASESRGSAYGSSVRDIPD